METPPTAREILAKHAKNYAKTVERDEKTLYHLSLNGFEAINAMVEFGRLCASEALKAASKVKLLVVENDYGGVRAGCKYYTKEVDVDSILLSYPLENIK